jgi:hypothetical protein
MAVMDSEVIVEKIALEEIVMQVAVVIGMDIGEVGITVTSGDIVIIGSQDFTILVCMVIHGGGIVAYV